MRVHLVSRASQTLTRCTTVFPTRSAAWRVMWRSSVSDGEACTAGTSMHSLSFLTNSFAPPFPSRDLSALSYDHRIPACNHPRLNAHANINGPFIHTFGHTIQSERNAAVSVRGTVGSVCTTPVGNRSGSHPCSGHPVELEPENERYWPPF